MLHLQRFNKSNPDVIVNKISTGFNGIRVEIISRYIFFKRTLQNCPSCKNEINGVLGYFCAHIG